ncbi:MAG TPA: cytosine permease [Vicinamibacterales bacterium]|nr:cytosine permease [Vicinamibacterales bacterium]HPW19870.1 cytosine permease [Vicinamibacterales bacterium]
MNPADIAPVAPGDRRQSPLDLFVIFAGANIVATTLQVGAALAADFGAIAAVALIAAGAVGGSALVASLSVLGPRLGVPSVIAARAALGVRGAALVAGLLYVTNFAWIAVNNVIAASVGSQILGGPGAMPIWVVGLGLVSTAVVALGPRAVGLADRVAVPLLLLVGLIITWAVVQAPPAPAAMRQPPAAPAHWLRGFDIVVGYQVSWILMFADFSRYTTSERAGAAAVFFGLLLTSLWMMPLGLAAARVAHSADPGAMMAAVGLGWAGAALMVLATITTNFVNIYMSGLAWKSLFPRAGAQSAVWSVGIVGTLFGLCYGTWLDRYAEYMVVLGGILVPVGGVLVAHFRLSRTTTHVPDLYDPAGPCRGVLLPGVIAWALGAFAYYVASSWGGTLPALATAVVSYLLLRRRLAWR